MRLKTRWHDNSGKTLQEMGSALAFTCFRLTKNQLEDLINEKFQVERSELFGIIAAYLVFLANIIDRLSFHKLTDEQRRELLTAVVKQLAHYYSENKNDVYKTSEHSARDFVTIYNQMSSEYTHCTKVDYLFYKVFASHITAVAKEEDKYWINQQMIEIQGPDSYEQIYKAYNNVVNVERIVSKSEKTDTIGNKLPRAKRKRAEKAENS